MYFICELSFYAFGKPVQCILNKKALNRTLLGGNRPGISPGWLLLVPHSLVLEVLHQALHVVQVGLQLHLVVAQAVKLSAQVGDVGLEHGVNVGAGGGLSL